MRRVTLACCIATAVFVPAIVAAQIDYAARNMDYQPFFRTAAATVSISSSVGTSTSVVIAAANPYRIGLSIYNNGANSAYLTYGTTSSGSSPTRILATFANWDMTGPVFYTGPIAAIRNAGSGTMIVTEINKQ